MSQADQIIRAGYSIGPGKEWTDKAAAWPVVTVSRKTEPGHMYATIERGVESVTATHLCCAECDGNPSVFCLSPDGETGYTATVADILAGILSHIRRTHST
jgi:hypothetical protein